MAFGAVDSDVVVDFVQCLSLLNANLVLHEIKNSVLSKFANLSNEKLFQLLMRFVDANVQSLTKEANEMNYFFTLVHLYVKRAERMIYNQCIENFDLSVGGKIARALQSSKFQLLTTGLITRSDDGMMRSEIYIANMEHEYDSDWIKIKDTRVYSFYNFITNFSYTSTL